MGLALASYDTVAARVRSARRIDFCGYVLPPGPMFEALRGAARGGAAVHVTLQRNPYHGGASERRMNRRAAAALTRDGAAVTLLDRERTPFHLKAAVCDGVAYLNDRNWPASGAETIVADDRPSDVALVERAMRGDGGENATLATRKDAALRREATLIDGAGRAPVWVETESFGAGAVSAALRRHALSGAATTLIVSGTEAAHNPRERALLRSLAHDGVDVRTSGVNEKFALAGNAAWIGSANATYAAGTAGAQIEWGAVTRAPAIVAALRAAAARDARAGARASPCA